MNSHSTSDGSLRLSVILPTDTAKTIEPVLRNLGRQTIAREIEIVLVSDSADHGPPFPFDHRQHPFGKLTCVAVDQLSPLGRARAAGVRAATAPFVFIGETHSFLRPDAAEKLLYRAATENCCAVVPGFENENPTNLWSWAAFLGDYGAWSAAQPPVELREPPVYNVLIRRDVLLSLNEALADALYHGDQLRRELERLRARTVFEPSARIGHVNLDRLRHLWREHLMIGRMIGARRAREWALPRRAAYFAAGPLIPCVLLRRALPGIRASRDEVPSRLRTVALVFALKAIRAAGEMAGYLGVPATGLEAKADLLEIHKFAHTSDPSLADRV